MKGLASLFTPRAVAADLEPRALAPAAEQAVARPKQALYIPSLDGIRALSFLLVFVSHAGLGKYIPGGFGVTIFFFLSGYLITTLLRIEFDRTQTINLKHFYMRRVLRIFPPFYIVLIAATLLTAFGVIQGVLVPSAVLSQVFYYNNFYVVNASFDGMAPGTGIFWSLAVEEHFYLVFPAVYLLLRRFVPSRGKQALLLAGVCVAVLAWRCVLVYLLNSPENRTYVATDTRIDSILLGCMLAIYGNPILDSTGVSERWWKWVWVPVGLAGLGASLLYRDAQFRETFRYTIQGVCLFPLFIASIRYAQQGLFRLLNLRWVRFLGTLSYSLYLVHFVFLVLLLQRTSWPTAVQGVVALALSIATATAIYYTVERPAARLRRRPLHAEARQCRG